VPLRRLLARNHTHFGFKLATSLTIRHTQALDHWEAGTAILTVGQTHTRGQGYLQTNAQNLHTHTHTSQHQHMKLTHKQLTYKETITSIVYKHTNRDQKTNTYSTTNKNATNFDTN